MEIEIDAPADLVWKMISEGDGIRRWFAPEANVTPGVGGSIRLGWGPGMEGTTPITVWEPGRRVQWTEDHGGRPRVVDFILEGEGGRTRLRLVHSGFGAEASFDNEYDSTFGGWKSFLAMLRYASEHFPDGESRHLCQMQMTKIPQPELAARLMAALGSPSLAEGQPCRIRWADDSGLSGRAIALPRPGYACLAIDQWQGSMLALFAEHGVLTISAILFGAAVAESERIGKEIGQAFGRVFET